tara:strand:+ start:737 stop:1633 length:897 start_codon:yes stop_codon:yes gene_type:complete
MDFTYENLRKWFKKASEGGEEWVRVSTTGKILGPCGKKKAQKNPARCLPKKKAQSLSKKERAKTARKKKRGGSKGKQFVKNTKKAKVKLKKEMKLTEIKDIIGIMIDELSGCYDERINEGKKKKKKKDRCHRKADSVYGTKTSAYKSGAIVKCRKGMIWKKGGKKKKRGKRNENIAPNHDGKSAPFGSGYEPIEENMSVKEVLDMIIINENITEAKFKGKTVKLNKIMRGDSKKFKVYVNSGKKNADGSIKVKKVNFGQKGMNIKKSNPKRRKAFRARHRCDNPGPKTMARYWACKTW